MEIRMNLNIFAVLLLFLATGQIALYSFFMFCILLHEIGHLLVGIGLGLKPKRLQIMPLRVCYFF